MTTKRIAVLMGTRPEVIKLAPVCFELQRSAAFDPVIISTAQHREMLDQALAVFGLKPEYDLNLMEHGQSLETLTAKVVSSVAAVLKAIQPAAALIQGDTTTVLGSAIAAFYAKIPVGHVEAGLRTYDMEAPWPEEMNRRLTDPISRWCFAPTSLAAQNLLAEQIPSQQVFITGNTVVDALFWMKSQIDQRGVTADQVTARCGIPDDFRRRFLLNPGSRWVLMTGHRRESFGSGFERICRAILRATGEHPDVGFLYPVHLNPNVREPVTRLLGQARGVTLIEPVGYEDFIWLLDRCTFVLSDSGGVQEEAPSLGKPVLVTRDKTERPEGVDAGTCRLVGTDPDTILAEMRSLLEDPQEYDRRSRIRNPYGDGTASKRILEVLGDSLG